MGKVKGKHRLDKYYRLAKEHGYRSRASWKLIQLDAKYSILRSSRAVLDLCAAPGGWMQVAVQRVPVGSLVLGIDLVPIAPVRGAVSFEQDITKPECKAKIKRVMNDHGCKAFDLVLHDGSPNVGGAWAQEAMSQNALVIDSVRLATSFLAPKGTFVTKVFRSQDYSSVLFCLKQLFEKVEVDKPAASRSASAEIFILGLKYKAPAKIDPRLLDVRHLFQASAEPQSKVVDVLRGTKQKRHRDGYEDGVTIIRKVASAADFIRSDSPLEILGSVTSISFEDPASVPLKDHELTTEEVKALCDDLRVLGKQDFKHLLKWRMHLRKALAPSVKVDPAPAAEETKTEEDEGEKLLNEMEDLKNAMERKKKREKKVIAKRQSKEKQRKALGVKIDAMEDGYMDTELFSLSSIKDKKDLVAVDDAENDDDGAMDLKDSDDEDAHEENQDVSSSDVDSDEERERYDKQIEGLLDQAYEHFTAKKDGSSKQRKRAKLSYSKDQLLEDDEEAAQIDYDSEKDHDDHEVNPLVVPLEDGEKPTQEEIANKWFSQDIFAEAANGGDLDKFDSGDEMEIDTEKEKPSIPKKDEEKKAKKAPRTEEKKAVDDFEIVPAPATDSDESSSDESDGEDINKKAEILACAKKMLRKKQRNQLLDDAYNKYMYDDEGLPSWFLDEENRHRVPIKPVTKEEINAMRAQFKEIDARPAKKVAEAKARKKRVAHKKLEKARKKANVISDQTDINERSKNKMIDQLYKKATVQQKPKREYVVAKKGVQVKAGKGKVLVDRRMKKDARGMRKAEKGKGKKGKNAKPQGNKAKPQGKKGRK